MRQKLVVGNWKMHGDRDLVNRLVEGIIAGRSQISETVEIGICPTYIHIEQAAKLLIAANLKIGLGAQNVYYEEKGAYTGEVSAPMLAQLGVSLVIVGHSERRELFAESDALIVEKFKAVQANNMTPILCIGESLEQREQGIMEDIVLAQLGAVICEVGIDAFNKAVIAYEPIWAIGTGKTATPDKAQEVHRIIREYIADQDKEVAAAIKILYGGSVKSGNARELFDQADIDGGLVGGASLEAAEFISICKSADLELCKH
jgi:triosephosphate isomerase